MWEPRRLTTEPSRPVTGIALTERFGQTLGTSSTYRNKKKCRKHLICELQLKECCTCIMVLRHILAVLCEIRNTFRDRWTRRGGPTAWPPRSPDLNPLDLRPCWQQRGTSPSCCGCLSDYPQLPRHLWTDAAIHDETCRGVHWISLRTFWAFVIDVLFQLWLTN
jgi:hypothetical protein